MIVKTREEAWAEVNKIFQTDYEKDEASSQRTGYDIYRHPTLNYYSRICDLGDRLEVLTGEYGEDVVNIWIKPEGSEATKPEESVQSPGYGKILAEKIRETADLARLTNFEKFVLDRGWKYNTKEDLKAGYDRAWKCSRNVMLSEEEFIVEAGEGFDPETLKEVHAALVALVRQRKLEASEIYRYAYFNWCLRNPEAIIAYKDYDRWLVNDCGTEIAEEDAKIRINKVWGFEASRIEIVGTPYYESGDWQFIRFDCACMTWLWKNQTLYQVFA